MLLSKTAIYYAISSLSRTMTSHSCKNIDFEKYTKPKEFIHDNQSLDCSDYVKPKRPKFKGNKKRSRRR